MSGYDVTGGNGDNVSKIAPGWATIADIVGKGHYVGVNYFMDIHRWRHEWRKSKGPPLQL